MRSFAEYIFDIGYFPLLHESVKHDFIQWYYEASKAEKVRNGLDVDNSELIQLAQDAGVAAEKFDENHKIPKLIELYEDYKAKIEYYFIYGAVAAFIIGGCMAATGILYIQEIIFSAIFGIVGSVLSISAVGLFLLHKVLFHQLKSNIELVKKINKELVEKPGNVRKSEQDWNKLVAKLMWNKSLLSPTTHACIMLLSIIRLLSTYTYGIISADLQSEIQNWVGMDAREIISTQAGRIVRGDIPGWKDR